MKKNNRKKLLAIAGAALIGAAAWMTVPSQISAFEKVTGQDKAGKNCERIDSPGSSTFGKCESVCKDKEVTRDAPNNRWVCKAARVQARDDVRAPQNGGKVLEKTPNKSPKSPRPGTGKVVRIRRN